MIISHWLRTITNAHNLRFISTVEYIMNSLSRVYVGDSIWSSRGGLSIARRPTLRPHALHLLRVAVAVRRNQIPVAVRSVELGLVKVELLAVQRLDAGLQRHDAQVDVIEAAKYITRRHNIISGKYREYTNPPTH